MTDPTNIVVIISGNGSNLQSIIDAIENGQVNARISAVISNNADAYGLIRAQHHGLESKVVDHRKFESRAEFDQTLLETVASFQPDFIVLAGFMRILGSAFIQAYRNRILNIHPSILPEYKGLNTHQRAMDNLESEHGVSIHIVTNDLDDGPILLRGRYPIEKEDTLADLQTKGHKLEHQMFPKLLEWICNHDLEIMDETIFFKQLPLKEPIEFDNV